MIERNISVFVKKYSREYPIIAIVGPRQSGKSTLARHLFRGYKYISLENLDYRHWAEDDPRGFLEDNGEYLILDEIQRVPSLFSYLQERVDFKNKPALYILTGSQQFLLMESIAQSLAGRIITFRLFPFTVNELFKTGMDTSIEGILSYKKKKMQLLQKIDIDEIIISGLYPRIHDKKLSPGKWIENYIATYVERDIRSLVNVENLRLFENFIKICASHSGQLVNYAAISNALGISQPTVKKWLSLLETSGIVFMLQPFYNNFSKRIVKTPKLYFIDTGLVCFLLGLRNKKELSGNPLYGNIFETFIVSEIYKRFAHISEFHGMYFWRDKTGNEIDLIIDSGGNVTAVEIKSSKTYNPDFKNSIERWFNIKGDLPAGGIVIYRGDEIIGKSSKISIVPFAAI